MYERILAFLSEWNESTDERRKLQHTFAFGGVAILVIAGLVGLFNYNLGQILLNVALISIAVFFINAIVWALMTAFVFLRLDNYRPAPKPRTRKR